MADDMLTITDLVAFDLGIGHRGLSEMLNAAPLIGALPAITASDGGVHKYTKWTAGPTVAFRAANAGRDFDHSEDTQVTVTCTILDWSFAVDKAVADARGRERVIAREQVRHVAQAMFEMEKQTIQGTNNSATGFAGWEDSTYLDALADDMVINGGGAATLTSCYLIRANDEEVASVYAGDNVTTPQDTIVQDMLGSNSLHMPAYYTPGTAHVATQHGSKYSIARICNLDGGANDLTDDLIYEAISAFPAGRGPTHCVMNRRSQKGLRESRTATNATGAPAPMPTTVADGIPVIVTDAIGNAEAALV